MKSPRRSPRIGHLLEKSSLCEWSEACEGVTLSHPSHYATKYRPDLDLVLKDINVTVVRVGGTRDIVSGV
jgi:hypothetical protein